MQNHKIDWLGLVVVKIFRSYSNQFFGHLDLVKLTSLKYNPEIFIASYYFTAIKCVSNISEPLIIDWYYTGILGLACIDRVGLKTSQ